MNWAWTSSFDQVWRSPAFPLWLTVAAACFFGLIVLFTLLRADKSIANGALTVIALLAIGVALAATAHAFNPAGQGAGEGSEYAPEIAATLPVLSCVDDMAGEAVLAACEKVLFGSPDAVAAAVSYTAARIARLASFGDVADANTRMTPQLQSLRRSIERDRYGLAAYVLSTRDHCQPSDCAAFKSVVDHNQIAANMEEHIYEGLVDRHKAAWNEPAVTASAVAPQTFPTGKPTTAEFPTAASIPPVNIMTPEPAPPAPSANLPPRPATASIQPAAPRPAPAKRVAAKPHPRPVPVQSGPVQLTPAPKTSND